MASLFINVQLRRDISLPQRQVEADAVLRRHHLVIIGVGQERGRRFRRDLLFVREVLNETLVGLLAQQIRPGAFMRVPFRE